MTKQLALVALAMTLAIPAPARSQIGGLVRKKAEEAMKGDKPKAKDATASDDGSKLGFVLDQSVVQSFKRGLDIEIHARQDYRKRVAALKTPDQWEACRRTASTGPEGLKLAEEMAKEMDKIKTPEDSRRVAEKMTEKSNTMILKACGEDPKPIIQSQSKEFQKAEEAGARELGKAFNKPSDSGQNDEETAPLGPFLSAYATVRADTLTTAEAKRRYNLLKEWVEFFCKMPKQSQQEAAAKGIKVQGAAPGFYWVYTKDEAKWLAGDCDEILKRLKELQ